MILCENAEGVAGALRFRHIRRGLVSALRSIGTLGTLGTLGTTLP